jgi:hypothetical protein
MFHARLLCYTHFKYSEMVTLMRQPQPGHLKKPISETIAKVLGTFGEVRLGYLYGSFLKRGDYGDIDVAVFLHRELSPYERFKLSSRIATEVERTLIPRHTADVRVLNEAPLSFQYEVILTGEAVFVVDEVARVTYEADLTSAYLDFKETADWLDREFLRW